MIVIDAAAFIDAVDGRRSVVERLENEDIHAPHLIDVEVAGVSFADTLVSRGLYQVRSEQPDMPDDSFLFLPMDARRLMDVSGPVRLQRELVAGLFS